MLIKFIDYEGTFRVTSIKYPLTIKISLYTLYLYNLKLKYSAPIPHIDDIAADFPELNIIMAHPAWPWIDEQIAVALHKSNVYIDLSGWSPKYIPSQLIREVNSRLQDKVMFGSDFPYLKPDRWLNEFDQLQLKPEVYKKVIYDNARKVIKGLPD